MIDQLSLTEPEGVCRPVYGQAREAWLKNSPPSREIARDKSVMASPIGVPFMGLIGIKPL